MQDSFPAEGEKVSYYDQRKQKTDDFDYNDGTFCAESGDDSSAQCMGADG